MVVEKMVLKNQNLPINSWIKTFSNEKAMILIMDILLVGKTSLSLGQNGLRSNVSWELMFSNILASNLLMPKGCWTCYVPKH
jgi:hypothetical protein